MLALGCDLSALEKGRFASAVPVSCSAFLAGSLASQLSRAKPPPLSHRPKRERARILKKFKTRRGAKGRELRVTRAPGATERERLCGSPDRPIINHELVYFSNWPSASHLSIRPHERSTN